MTMLVAYDGRENTEKALDYAIRNAKVYGEQLIVLSVVTRDGNLDETRERIETARVRAEKSGAEVRAIVESGEPDKVILQTASRFGCDTIIVGRSNKKSSFDRVVLGSVSNSIVANAGCTVIVVQRRMPRAFTSDLITLSGVGGHPGMNTDGSILLTPSGTTSPPTNNPPDMAHVPDAITSLGSGTAS